MAGIKQVSVFTAEHAEEFILLNGISSAVTAVKLL
jgi:hypothetical protein